MKKRFIAAVIICAGLLLANALAADTMINSPAPDFKVASGSGENLALADLKGKVVVLFYETKDTIEVNRPLKEELNKFYAAQPRALEKIIRRVAVINCNGVFFTGAWKNALKENSKKEGLTIYGDWDGKMAAAYKVKDKDSNLIIIDKNGRIRYDFAGKVAQEDFSAVKDLLSQLLKEQER
jgi:predicted transcriptional regulator